MLVEVKHCLGDAAEGQAVFSANSHLCSVFAFAFDTCKTCAHLHGGLVVLVVAPGRGVRVGSPERDADVPQNRCQVVFESWLLLPWTNLHNLPLEHPVTSQTDVSVIPGGWH